MARVGVDERDGFEVWAAGYLKDEANQVLLTSVKPGESILAMDSKRSMS
jgi:hypothetical protein